MITAVVAEVLVAVLFAALAPPLGRRLPPAPATRLLVGGGVAVTASALFVLAVMAFTWIGQLPQVAALGPWSPIALRRETPVPDLAAAGVTLLLSVLAARSVRTVPRRALGVVTTVRDCRRLPGTSSLVVVDSDAADAFATPLRRGRIVVTTGLLRGLDPVERRVVLAHETSHLEHGHAWWRLAVELAAELNPLLGPTARVVADAVERWADEDAARVVADRRLAARALARTALLVHRRPEPPRGGALGVLSSDVPHRVHALLAPPPSPRPAALAVLIGLVLAGVVAAADVQQCGERLFERAFVPVAAPAAGAPTPHP